MDQIITVGRRKTSKARVFLTKGTGLITINKKKFSKDINETAFIPQGALHRIENLFKNSNKMEALQKIVPEFNHKENR